MYYLPLVSPAPWSEHTGDKVSSELCAHCENVLFLCVTSKPWIIQWLQDVFAASEASSRGDSCWGPFYNLLSSPHSSPPTSCDASASRTDCVGQYCLRFLQHVLMLDWALVWNVTLSHIYQQGRSVTHPVICPVKFNTYHPDLPPIFTPPSKTSQSLRYVQYAEASHISHITAETNTSTYWIVHSR